MNQETRYKYFNLIIKILIGVGAIGFILIKLKQEFYENIEHFKNAHVNYNYLITVVFLMFVNWGIETYKWNFLIKEVVKLPFFKAFKIVITGITVSLVTPNRVGEIPGRVFLLDQKERRKDLIWLTAIGSFTQLICTILFGSISLIVSYRYFSPYISSTMIIAMLIILLLSILLIYKVPTILRKIKRIKNLLSDNFISLSGAVLLEVFSASILRYLVFCFQYLLVLWAFNIDMNQPAELVLIPVCFLLASIIPTILLSEIGVRSSVAIFVFGMISDNVVAIVLSSVVLWIINIALPGLLGVFNLKQLKIFNK